MSTDSKNTVARRQEAVSSPLICEDPRSSVANSSAPASIGRGSNTPLDKARREGLREPFAECYRAPCASEVRGQRSPRPKTAGHLRAIYALGRKRGFDNDALHDFVLGRLAQNSTARRTGSFKDLTFAEAEHAIAALKGQDFVPRRTLQYRKAKAGVTTMVSKEALNLIAELATQRNWSAQTLVNFCKRQCGHQLRTTVDANKVIEALKAMNKRDGFWAAA